MKSNHGTAKHEPLARRAHKKLSSSPCRGQSTLASLGLLAVALLRRTNSVDTACRAPGVVRDVCCLGDPLMWAGEGLHPDWQVKKRLICDTSQDFSHPTEQRKLARSLNTVVNQEQANDAIWVCMDPNVLYSVLILYCLL